jgi:hypothetical protein
VEIDPQQEEGPKSDCKNRRTDAAGRVERREIVAVGSEHHAKRDVDDAEQIAPDESCTKHADWLPAFRGQKRDREKLYKGKCQCGVKPCPSESQGRRSAKTGWRFRLVTWGNA